MKLGVLGLAYLLFVLAEITVASPYFDDDGDEVGDDTDYSDNGIENLMRAAQQKRACVPRGGNCDHRPNNCCYSSSCRCNLWGSNCRCQRVGLFQKWG